MEAIEVSQNGHCSCAVQRLSSGSLSGKESARAGNTRLANEAASAFDDFLGGFRTRLDGPAAIEGGDQ